jgi:hypothetical protein
MECAILQSKGLLCPELPHHAVLVATVSLTAAIAVLLDLRRYFLSSC